MLPQSSDIFTKGSDMLNKNTLDVKMCEANKKHPYLCATKIFDISWGQKKMLNDFNYIDGEVT